MKTSKYIIASVAAAILATVSFAETSANEKFPQRPSPEQIVSLMFAHDNNRDGVLDSGELANSIESFYDSRRDAIRERREMLVEKGVISEAEYAKGFITLSLLPEDGAAIVMKDGDANRDQALSVDELVASIASLRKLDLGTRSSFARRS